jgi:hypothetical protein
VHYVHSAGGVGKADPRIGNAEVEIQGPFTSIEIYQSDFLREDCRNGFQISQTANRGLTDLQAIALGSFVMDRSFTYNT